MDKLEQGCQLFKTWLSGFESSVEIKWPVLKTELRYEKVSKNYLLLQHGEKENRIRFLLSGFVKACYHNGESSFVHSFRNSLDICCVVTSFFGDTSSDFSLQAVMPTEYVYIEKSSLNGLLNQMDGFDELLLKITNKHTDQLYHDLATLRSCNAEERLRLFAQKYPDVMKYAKNKDIASALEITPQTFSKLRKKVYLIGEREI